MKNWIDDNENHIIESRYVHTGNSGATIKIYRDFKLPNRANLQVDIAAMGAVAAQIDIMGQGLEGFSSEQLRDLGTMFFDAAAELDKKPEDQKFMARVEKKDIAPLYTTTEGWDGEGYNFPDMTGITGSKEDPEPFV